MAFAASMALATTAPAQENLRVAVFGGAWQEAIRAGVIADFEKKNGVKVTLEATNYNEVITKLRASGGKNPPYDIMPLTPQGVAMMSAANLIVELDASRITGLPDVSPFLLDMFSLKGKRYAIPFVTGQLALAYRTDLVPEPPTTWLDLYDPKYKKCGVAVMPPSVNGGGVETMNALIRAMGGDEFSTQSLDKAFKVIEAGKSNVIAFPASSADMGTLLQRGEICLGALFDGRTIELSQSGLPLGIAFPKEGSVASGNGFGIAAGSKNVDLAYKFLASLIDPAAQATFADRMFYATSNTKTPYGQTFRKYHKDSINFEKMIWVDYTNFNQRVMSWQSRWETVFK